MITAVIFDLDNTLLDLIKMFISGNLSSKIPDILTQVLSLIKEPLRQFLSGKVKESKQS